MSIWDTEQDKNVSIFYIRGVVAKYNGETKELWFNQEHINAVQWNYKDDLVKLAYWLKECYFRMNGGSSFIPKDVELS